ncbi:MAG: TylF/MycF/NovP-related O-methyltransferase [Gemmataceae bacterium]
MMSRLKNAIRQFLGIPPQGYQENCFFPAGWGQRERGYFNREAKAYLFRAIMTFFSTNSVPGDYFEFGCCGAYTMRMAWDYTKLLLPEMRYFGFDSFAGFPEVEGIDLGHWKKGDLAMSEDDFRQACVLHGMPEGKLATVKGFFADTLTAPHTKQQLAGRRAAIIFVDVDVYSAARAVLEFIPPYLQRGTIIVFDDWNCFYADDSLGERRAWREFTMAHPEITWTPYVSTHMAQSFICQTPSIS